MISTLTLTMNDETSKAFNFLATGTTATRFRMIFGRDLMMSITPMTKLADVENNDEVFQIAAECGLIDVVQQLGYVMNKQAEKADMNTEATIEDYLEWLDQFDSFTLLNHSLEIISVYLSNRSTTSTQKKRPARQSGK